MREVIVHLKGNSVRNLRKAAHGRMNRAGADLLAGLESAYSFPTRHCVMCSCTDNRACRGGCSWVLKFPASFTGVCSKCWKKFESQVWLVDAEEVPT